MKNSLYLSTMDEQLIMKNILIAVFSVIARASALKGYGPLAKNQTMEMGKIMGDPCSTSVEKIAILLEKRMLVWRLTVFL
jgi:hypothetical protein